MRMASRDVLGTPAGPQIDREQIVTHVTCIPADAVLMTVAKLAKIIVPPALGGIIIEQYACIMRSTSEMLGTPASPEIDGRQIVTHLIWTSADVAPMTLAKLAVNIVPPALAGIIIKQCACKESSRFYKLDTPAGPQIDGW